MEWESDSPCRSHAYPRQEYWSPGRRSGWQLEFRDYEAIAGRGLLLSVERQIERIWGRRSWWEMQVEKRQAVMQARRYCWVTCMGWSHHHSPFLPTRQHRQLNNREAGQLNTWRTELQSRTPTQNAPFSDWCADLHSWTPARGLLYMPDSQNNREGPQAWELSKFLNGQSYRERLAKEAFWFPATRSLKKDSDRAITPAAEAVCVPEHLALPGPLPAKQLAAPPSHSTLIGAELPQAKNFLPMCAGSLRSCLTLATL